MLLPNKKVGLNAARERMSDQLRGKSLLIEWACEGWNGQTEVMTNVGLNDGHQGIQGG